MMTLVMKLGDQVAAVLGPAFALVSHYSRD